MRLPNKLVDRQLLDAFLGEIDCAEFRTAGANLIVEIRRDELELENADDGSGMDDGAPCPVTRVIGHAFRHDTPGGFMVNKPLKRRHGDAGAAEFAASSRVSPASANGGKRP